MGLLVFTSISYMDAKNTVQRAEAMGRLRDIVMHVDHRLDPFLYHLPELLDRHEFMQIPPDHAVRFAELATKHERLQVVEDAMHILNKLISAEDGGLVAPTRDMFYENRSFFWDELGSYTKTPDVISHIFNKTFFFISVGQHA